MSDRPWYTETREVRVTKRGRQMTSKYMQKKVAERTLKTRKVDPQDAIITDRKRDASRTVPYDPPIVNGRLCN